MPKFILQNRLLLPLCRGQKGVKKYGYSHRRILKNYTQPGRETLTDVESEHTLFGNIGLFNQMLFSHYYQIEKNICQKKQLFCRYCRSALSVSKKIVFSLCDEMVLLEKQAGIAYNNEGT